MKIELERRKGGRVKNGSRSVEVDRARLACCRCGRASLSLSLSMSARAPVKNNENSGRALANRLSPLYSFYQHEKDLIALYLPPQSVCALGTRAKAYTHTLPHPLDVSYRSFASLLEYGEVYRFLVRDDVKILWFFFFFFIWRKVYFNRSLFHRMDGELNVRNRSLIFDSLEQVPYFRDT